MDDRPEKLSECGLLSPTSHLGRGRFPLITSTYFVEQLTVLLYCSVLWGELCLILLACQAHDIMIIFGNLSAF